MFKPLIEILRVEESKDFGTFGVLLLQSEAFCVTLEPPYFLNRKWASAIPEGQYLAYRVKSEHFGEVFQLSDVPERDAIEIHPGNTLHDTFGCIIIGASYGKLRNHNRAVLNSGDTFRRFMAALKDYDVIHVSVRWVW